jgi:hypothetical protein
MDGSQEKSKQKNPASKEICLTRDYCLEKNGNKFLEKWSRSWFNPS